jgi:MYXO-CTERM domain-containing protein
MKRTCLISSALALTVLAPTVASAEPGILYIPTDPITLRPTGMAPCGSSINSALGCGGVSQESEIAPYPDAGDLTGIIGTELDAYDVHVTNTRPPEYISYVMLMMNDEPNEMSTSFTCTSVGINCGSRQRNDLAFTRGSTMNCMDPVQLHAALYAFGRASGLEGVDNPDDYMNYVPDYMTPPMGFMDACSDRVQQIGFNDAGMQVNLPLECTSVDHTDCPNGANGQAQQNSHQDLLEYYGARTEDTDPPVLTNIAPGDGAVLMQGDALVIDVDIEDADPVVGVRWTISSPALVDLIGVDTFSQCTNEVCDANWGDATPLKATDSDWSVTFQGLRAGEYTITLEAADYHGNVAEMTTFTVTIEGEPSGTGGVDETGGNETGTPPPFTTGEDAGETGDGTGNGSGATDDGGGGCSCRTTSTPGGSMALMLLGLMGLGAMRRRW